MDINRLSLVKASALASTLLLTACGGGGGGDSETSPDPEPNPTPKSLNFTNVSVSENSNSVVYTAKADSTGTSFSIVSGADKDLFNLDGTSGNLSFKTIPDFESPADSNQDNVYEITIRAQNGETSKDLALKLTVSNIPVEAIANQTVTVDENSLAITTLSAEGENLSFAISGGADENLLQIDSITGELSFNNAPDFEIPNDSDGNNSYLVEVSISDGENTVTSHVEININDLLPVINSFTIKAGAQPKTLEFDWDVDNRLELSHFTILTDKEGLGNLEILEGAEQISADESSFAKSYPLHLTDFENLAFQLSLRTSEDSPISSSNVLLFKDHLALNDLIGEFSQSDNIGLGLDSGQGSAHWYGEAVALSGDGNTMVVSAPAEESNASGINGDEHNDSLNNSGAVYVFERNGINWAQTAYIKANTSIEGEEFGGSTTESLQDSTRSENSVSISDNGNLIAIGTPKSDENAGRVDLYEKQNGQWEHIERLEASNKRGNAGFGASLHLAGNGESIVIGASRQDSATAEINPNNEEELISNSGAIYVFKKTNTGWEETDFIKASNPSRHDMFGHQVKISYDGTIIAASAPWEDSNATGVGQTSDLDEGEMENSGAVYVFHREENGTWLEHSFIKTSINDKRLIRSGFQIALSGNGQSLYVSAQGRVSIYELENNTWREFQVFTDDDDIHDNNDSLFSTYNNGYLALNLDGTIAAIRIGNRLSIYNKKETHWERQTRIDFSNIGTRSPIAISSSGTDLAITRQNVDIDYLGVNGSAGRVPEGAEHNSKGVVFLF